MFLVQLISFLVRYKNEYDTKFSYSFSLLDIIICMTSSLISPSISRHILVDHLDVCDVQCSGSLTV